MTHSSWCLKGLGGALIGLVLASSSMAVIEQSVAAEWDPDYTHVVRAFGDYDSFQSPPGSPTTITASLSGDGFEAISAAGPFGNLGMMGRHFIGGTMLTKADIRCDEFFNLAGSARNARAQFIIDGGSLVLLGGGTSTLQFLLSLEALVYDSGHNFVRSTNWQAWALLTSVDWAAPTLQLGGEDIGIHMASMFEAEIPLSLQTFEMGSIPAGGQIDLHYQVWVESRAPAVEILRWQFSDPLSLDNEQEAPKVFFDPVPEPATLAGLGMGLLALRRRRA